MKTPISLSGATMMEIKELIEKPSLSSLTNMVEKQKSQRESRWDLCFSDITRLEKL